MQVKTDRLCGIDRYEVSPARGKLAEPVIYLWRSPGLAPHEKNLGGALKHGDEVEVLDVTQHKQELWHRVAADVEHEGKTYRQEGWVKAVLLEKAGLEVFGVSEL